MRGEKKLRENKKEIGPKELHSVLKLTEAVSVCS